MNSLFLNSSRTNPRHEHIFVLLVGLFIGTLVTINILGMGRFFDFTLSIGEWNFPVVLSVGILPFPLTLLCVDLISEFYGKQRAKLLIWVGFFINTWIIFLLWIGGYLPPAVELDPLTQLPAPTHPDYAFFRIRATAIASMISSTVAYLTAQFLDVYLFQLLKRITAGKHLWLRYNLSAWLSQLVDTIIVVTLSLLLAGGALQGNEHANFNNLGPLIYSCYLFKIFVATLATLPFYLLVGFIRRYLLSACTPTPAVS